MNTMIKNILILGIFFSPTSVAESDPIETNGRGLTPEVLARLPVNGWPTNGGDTYNRRYSPVKRIHPDNVSDLKAVWRARLNGSGIGAQYSGEAQPIVHNGIIYVITGAHDVFAVSVETGGILWEYKAELDPDMDTVCCGWTSRGVALGDGMVYIGRLDGKLVALDQETGEVRWSTEVVEWREGYTITSAPLYYDGMVVTGFSGAEFAARGQVKAYDARDGSPLWTFNTIPGPGEFGHETWPADNDSWKTGGGTVWQTPAVDPELGLLYFATGNPAPDFNGAVRKGDNLFTNSIVALDAATGEYRWHFQQVRHDLWDLDSANPVVLFDMEVDDEPRKAIVQVSKTGWAYILDRETGEPLLGIEDRAVMQEPRQHTAATQPFPKGDAIAPQTMEIPPEGYELINEGHTFTPFWTEPVVTKRASTNWPPSAYDPETETLFVCAREYILHFVVDPDTSDPVKRERYYGGTFGGVPISNGLLAALDMKTNTIVWRQRWPEPCYSGITATGGNLLFIGRNDGRLTAVDSRNGKKLWEFSTDAGVNAPASVFEYKGEQYVTVLSAGNTFVGSDRGDSLWLFALSGDIEDSEIERTDWSSGVDLSARNTNGEKIYSKACQFCHGSNGEGGENGVSLINARRTDLDAIRQIIRQGGSGMPAWENKLTSLQIKAVAEYVKQFQKE